jgi:hypothetical protein
MAVLWAAVISGVLLGCFSLARHSRLASIALLLIASLALLVRLTPTRSFYGLEYEDAYVYAAASRLASTPIWSISGAGLDVCSVGSVTDCEETETYPGHFPGLAALLTVVQSVVPYSPELPPTVGAVLAALATMTVGWAVWLMTGSWWPAIVASLLFATTPVIALYGGSACSENASSFALAASFGAIAGTRRCETPRSWWRWHALVACAVLLACSVRRENAILIVLSPLCLLFGSRVPAKGRVVGALIWVAIGAVIVPILLRSLVSEVGEYGSFSFGATRLFDSVSPIALALLSPEWFGLLGVAAALGAVLAIVRRPSGTDTLLVSVVAVVAMAMGASYAAHVRSTYQLFGVAVNAFDYLRYLSNVGVPLCILASMLVAFHKGRKQAQWTAGVLAIYFVVCGWLAVGLREQQSADEQDVRTEPAVAAIKLSAALGDVPVLTLEPLVMQVHGSATTRVVSLPSLTADRVKSLGRFLYLRQAHYDNQVDRRRYAVAWDALPQAQQVLQEDDGWSIVLMESVE